MPDTDLSALDAEIVDDTSPAASEVPAAVTAAFEKTFSNLSAEDKAELAELDPFAAAQADDARITRNRINKEQQDELIEEGLVSADDPDGAGLKPATEPLKPGETVETPALKAGETPAANDPINPLLRMAANEMGWSDEKIDRLLKADPELAQETMQTLADTYTNLSRQFLTPGSPVIPGTQPATNPPAQPEAPTSKLDQFYTQIEAFAETNGEDLANFAKALKSELIDPVRDILASNQAKQQELFATEARQTVATLGEKFSQFYGKDDKALSAIETNNRAYLAQVADQLRAGAKAQGRDLSIKDAINRAHLLVTADHRDQVVRKNIKEQVQSRAQQITAKPTQRRDPRLVSGRSTANAIEAASRKMAELGIEDMGE